MDDQTRSQLRSGMNVLGSDDDKLGEVDRLEGDYVVVKRGHLFPNDYYVPTTSIASINGDTVYLTEAKDAADRLGWDTPPPAGTTRNESRHADTPAQPHIGMSYDAERDAGIDTTAIPEERFSKEDRGRSQDRPGNRVEREQPFPHYADNKESHIDDTASDTIRVPLSEEELTASRRTVDRGTVRVEKDVVEEDRSLDVPVTEEEVHVERRYVDREPAPGETAFQEGTVEVPVRGQDVDVQKRARVTGEVDVEKRPVERTQRVTGTVRHEEAHVEDAATNVEANSKRSSR